MPGGGWHFDGASAFIGALLAWTLVGIAYANRERLQQIGGQWKERFVALRERFQADQEARYLKKMQEGLQSLLLFAPRDPGAVCLPPKFLAIAPVFDNVTADGHRQRLTLTLAELLNGHPRLLLVGGPGSGRTTALALLGSSVFQGAAKRPTATRFPVFIDLTHIKSLPSGERPALENLAQLAAFSLGGAASKWLTAQLSGGPALALLDNWEQLEPAERGRVAQWVSEVAALTPQCVWVVTAFEEGYGPLIEAGFVALRVLPPRPDLTALTQVCAGWARLLKVEWPSPPEDLLHMLHWAAESGDPWGLLHVRIMVYLLTQQLPLRPVEVLDAYLDAVVPTPNLGEEQQAVAEQARMLALAVLNYLAQARRLEGQALTRDDVWAFVAGLLPPAEGRPPKLEGALRKLINQSPLLRHEGLIAAFSHPLWEEFLAAWALVEAEEGVALVQEYADDLTWAMLIEFYAGLGDMTAPAQVILKRALTLGDDERLLRVARWTVVAMEDAPWRKPLLQALAQRFRDVATPAEARVAVGRALALIAAENGLPFFVQSLGEEDAGVRSAALRGIGWLGSPQEMTMLADSLADEHPEVRQAAVQGLLDMGGKAATQELAQAFFHADEEGMVMIAEALAQSEEGAAILQDAAGNADLLVRRAACYGLAQLQPAWAEELLVHLARDDKEWLVRSVADVMLKQRQERLKLRGVPDYPKVESLEWLMAWAARQGLGLGVGKAAWAMLGRALKEGDPETQIRGAEVLASSGRLRDVAGVQGLLRNIAAPEVIAAFNAATDAIERRYRMRQGSRVLEVGAPPSP